MGLDFLFNLILTFTYVSSAFFLRTRSHIRIFAMNPSKWSEAFAEHDTTSYLSVNSGSVRIQCPRFCSIYSITATTIVLTNATTLD